MVAFDSFEVSVSADFSVGGLDSIEHDGAVFDDEFGFFFFGHVLESDFAVVEFHFFDISVDFVFSWVEWCESEFLSDVVSDEDGEGLSGSSCGADWAVVGDSDEGGSVIVFFECDFSDSV